jgi:hypothetical protein
MDKKKPILLFFENLVEPIQTTKAEFELIEKEIALLNREFLRNGVFAYIFAYRVRFQLPSRNQLIFLGNLCGVEDILSHCFFQFNT